MTRRASALIVILGIAVAIAAGATVILLVDARPTGTGDNRGNAPSDLAPVDLSPRVANRPAGGNEAWLARAVETRPATLLRDITAHATAAGPAIADSGGSPLIFDHRLELAVLEGPVEVDGTQWLRVYLLSNPNWGPSDAFVWIPATLDGAPTVAIGPARRCPPEPTDIEAIAALGQLDRLRCRGTASFALRGLTWERLLPVWYRVAPSWLGDQQDLTQPTISLHTAPIQKFPNSGDRYRFLELQLPPGLEHPPPEFQIDVVVHFADATSDTCQRDVQQFAGLVPEAAVDSRLWCATRLVVERWTPVLGPEGRAIDARAPQLHRHPAAGGNTVCAGVGMAPLVFRIDPTKLDPVWLEAQAGGGQPIMPTFDPSYRLAFSPDLVVVDGAGRIVARNGTILDPDKPLAGHSVCPTIYGVFFD